MPDRFLMFVATAAVLTARKRPKRRHRLVALPG